MTRATARRGPLGQAEVEEAVGTINGDRPPPPLYLRLAVEEGELERYVVAYLLRVRTNGFMVVLPDVRAYLESLVYLAVLQRELLPAPILLVDFPWAGLENFLRASALRGLHDRANWVTMLQVEGVAARPMAGDTIDAAGRCIEPETAQSTTPPRSRSLTGNRWTTRIRRRWSLPLRQDGVLGPLGLLGPLVRIAEPQPAVSFKVARG